MSDVGRDEFDNLNERVEILESKYIAATDVISSELLGLRLRMQEGFNAVDSGFAQIDGRFQEIDRRFERIDERFGRIDERFEHIDARFEQVDVRLDAATAERREMNELISNVATEQQAQSQVMAQMLRKLDEL